MLDAVIHEDVLEFNAYEALLIVTEAETHEALVAEIGIKFIELAISAVPAVDTFPIILDAVIHEDVLAFNAYEALLIVTDAEIHEAEIVAIGTKSIKLAVRDNILLLEVKL